MDEQHELAEDSRCAYTQLTDGVNELKYELKHIQNRVKKLEKNEQKMVVGQLASKVEEAVLSHVMKGIGDHKKLAIYTINHLEKAIGKERRFTDTFPSEDDRRTAIDRWNELKIEIGWEARHYRDLEMLKEHLPSSRSEVTNVEQLRSAMGKVCQEQHLKGVCEEFLRILKKIES